MKRGKKNNEAPQGIDTTYLDTCVDNETKKKETYKLKKGHSTKYNTSHKQKDEQISKQE